MVPDIRRPPALQAREDPYSDGGRGPVRFAASFAGFMTISQDKKRMRREAETLRYRLGRSAPNAGQAISENFLGAGLLRSKAIVAGYIPMRGEADPSHLMARLREAGSSLALGRVAGKGQPLQFHLWEGDDAPVRGAFGQVEAASHWPSTIAEILLVPLLGFDKHGYRLGYGGGFYDRTLQSLRKRARVLAVGIAFAGQEMILPHDENDERLDWIVTEKYAREFEGN